jgi:Flp pilus assembly protein TadD
MAHRPQSGIASIIAPARRVLALGMVSAGLLLSGCSSGVQDSIFTSSIGSSEGAAAATPASSRAELEKATAYWSKEFSNNPRNVDAAVNYAKNLKAMGEKDRALAVLQQAAIYNSDHKGLASEYGRSALEADQPQLAEKLLARASDPLNPDWKVLSAHGAAMAKQGRHRDAIPLFERALAISPDNPSVMNNLGMAQVMNGDAAKAEATLRRAVELPGAAPRVRQNLALVLGVQGKFDEAKQVAGNDMPPEKVAASIAYLRRRCRPCRQSAHRLAPPKLPRSRSPRVPA